MFDKDNIFQIEQDKTVLEQTTNYSINHVHNFKLFNKSIKYFLYHKEIFKSTKVYF